MLFEPLAQAEIIKMVRRSAQEAREAQGAKIMMALDFLENRQRGHTESELSNRYRSAMSMESGGEMFPFCVPLTARYVDEAADVFNNNVPYEYERDDGTRDDETRLQSLKLMRMLGKARYDEVMHRNERHMVLLSPTPSAVWYQVKRGALRPVVQLPHCIWPVPPDSPDFADAADQADYDGFVVEVFHQAEGYDQKRTFALLTAAQTVYYEGTETSIDNVLGTWENAATWPQVAQKRDAENPQLLRVETKELPLMPLTFWHSSLPVGTLLPDTDCSIAQFNLEVNIALSALLDTVSWQSFAVPVLKTANPTGAKARQRYGVRFPMMLDLPDSFEMVAAATSYSEQVAVLKYIVQLEAQARRQSPNDFAVDGAIPSSGFAKMIDSLPKIQARKERIRPLKYLVEEVAGPIITSIGVLTGQLDPSAKQMRMCAQFPDVEFPQSEDEKSKKLERDLKYHFTSVVKEIARREGCSLDEAQQIYEENKKQNEGLTKTESPVAPVGVAGLGGGLGLGNRIRQARAGGGEPPRDGGERR